MESDGLPDAIRNAIDALSPNVLSVTKNHVIELLRMGALDLSDLVIFEDDGDIVLHWTGRGIYCDFLKNTNAYRVNKVVKHDGGFVENVVFLDSVPELFEWLVRGLLA
jgi:hypothetical protein